MNGKAVWIVAALVTLGGAAWFGMGREEGAREAGQTVPGNVPPAPAATENARIEWEGQLASPRAESRPTARNPPKPTVDQPFELIRELARAAYEGDGEAQYRISRELDRCEMTLSLVRKSIDPEAAIWNLPSGWTQGMKERAFAEYHRCARLLREDPFAGLPPRDGGYTAGYWHARAVESGHPVARVHEAINRLMVEREDSDAARQRRARAREMLVTAVQSGNPDALLLMGFRLHGSENAERRLQGAAWMLAACHAGADCGFDSAIVPFHMCYDAQCQSGMDVETMLGMSLGPAENAKAHVRYEQIAAALRAGDSAAIRALIAYQAAITPAA